MQRLCEKLGPLALSGPRYLRLERVLQAAIDDRTLAGGAALPSERDLSLAYGLSRVTVRRAIDELERSGSVTRRQGSGTYVVDRRRTDRLEKNFAQLSSFSEDMAARGRVPGSRWLSRASGAVSPSEALALNLSPGSAVHRFRRLRLADGLAVALETSTVAGFALQRADSVGPSLYAALAEAGHTPVRALQRLRAEIAGSERASLLQIEASHAGLHIERRAFLDDGRPVEVTQSFYRGDIYDMVAELGRAGEVHLCRG